MREVEFREGMRLVPDHVADILAAYPTYQMTYEEARSKMNSGFLHDRLRDIQRNAVREHLGRFGDKP